jgi:hypothetical protein
MTDPQCWHMQAFASGFFLEPLAQSVCRFFNNSPNAGEGENENGLAAHSLDSFSNSVRILPSRLDFQIPMARPANRHKVRHVKPPTWIAFNWDNVVNIPCKRISPVL